MRFAVAACFVLTMSKLLKRTISLKMDLNFEKRHNAGNNVTKIISSIDIGTLKPNQIIQSGPIIQTVSIKMSILICLSRLSGVLSFDTS